MYVDYGAPCLLSACYKVNILEMFGVAQTSDSKKKKKKTYGWTNDTNKP